MDKVDTLRYTWEKLLARASDLQNELVTLQPSFRKELIGVVEVFLQDCQQFYLDYDLVRLWQFLCESLGRRSRIHKTYLFKIVC